MLYSNRGGSSAPACTRYTGRFSVCGHLRARNDELVCGGKMEKGWIDLPGSAEHLDVGNSSAHVVERHSWCLLQVDRLPFVWLLRGADYRGAFGSAHRVSGGLQRLEVLLVLYSKLDLAEAGLV